MLFVTFKKEFVHMRTLWISNIREILAYLADNLVTPTSTLQLGGSIYICDFMLKPF